MQRHLQGGGDQEDKSEARSDGANSVEQCVRREVSLVARKRDGARALEKVGG